MLTNFRYSDEIKEERCENGVNLITVAAPQDFSVAQTFDCGQCFRFDPTEGGDGASDVSGVAFGKSVRIRQSGNTVTIYGATAEDYFDIWRSYLGFDTDYSLLAADILAHFPTGSVMTAAAEYGKGIRILAQDPFETLISFIISQNNNIPRIKKLVEALCRAAGEKIDGSRYAFPTPEAIISLGEDGLRELKTGFRAGYIFDAAKKAKSGEIDFEEISSAENTSAASDMLQKIKGVGPKVAACTLLFGFKRLDAFPVDVWIKRSFANHFGGSLDINSLGNYAGLAQQYLFYYERYNLN